MSTRQLIARVDALEQQLNLQRATLQLNTRQRVTVLKSISPLWLLVGGLAAGVLTGRFVHSGQHAAYALTLGGLKIWRLYEVILPSLVGGAGE
ncbi:hypothetical protein [Halopseudomonas salegens]|uniref:YqjK-like protein n=1 Tax=Halopseudomonas salegens TaxID=1434072 RepID=A0A1H2GZN6_9GAMM|nr:hypothetical protein [Halopseudomonas salegens]SDU25001.1 hypothetical protein SAMN05216210_2665 [Halopseudomonas salegens]